MPGRQLRLGLPALALAALFPVLVARAQPQGELTYAMHVTITPSWFDPAENTGIATPFMVQEALHDALVKPMPQNPIDRKSTRLNSSHLVISYAVFCLKKKKNLFHTDHIRD